MKRLKIDPDTSAMIKMGIIDCAFEVTSFYSEKVKHLKYPTIKNKKRASVDTQTRFQQRLLRYFLPYCCSMQSVLGLMVITDFPC